MILPRRKALQALAASLAVSLVPRSAAALDFPAYPVKIMVGNAPGGGLDLVARLLAKALSERLGQPFVVENRPGAGTNIATNSVVRSTPDGYTLLLAATPNAINATLYQTLDFNFIRDIAPVAGLAQSPLIMVVDKSFPAKTVAEFVAYAKANPGKVSYASAGVGTPLHIAGEMFKMASGIEMVHVPYKGIGAGLTDVFGGRVQAMFADMTAVEQIKAGQLQALAVTATTRAALLPDVPVMSDFYPGYEAATWIGIGAPRDTPPAILDKLHETIQASLVDPGVKSVLTNIGFAELTGSRADFRDFIAKNTATWAKVIQAADIKAE